MKHALLSPSSAHRWLACPGSVAANRDKPRIDNIHSLTGTTAHNLLEQCMRLEHDPMEAVDTVDPETKQPITEEMAEAVLYALEFVQDYVANDPAAVVRIEQPVYPAKLLGVKRELIWGTPDLQILGSKEVVTIDYKHGVGVPVAVKDNPQIKLYHLGAHVETSGRYRRYRSVVVQPRVPRRHPVQEHVIKHTELLDWAEQTVKPVIPIALMDGAPRKAGDHCKFCHASGRCDAQMDQTIKRAAKEFAKEPVDQLTPERTAELLHLASAVQVAIDDLRAYATQRAHAGSKIPGYVASFTRQRRLWADEEGAVRQLKALGLVPRDFYDVSLLSPAKVEKLLIERGLQERRRKGKPAPPNLLQDYYGFSEAQPSISKED